MIIAIVFYLCYSACIPEERTWRKENTCQACFTDSGCVWRKADRTTAGKCLEKAEANNLQEKSLILPKDITTCPGYKNDVIQKVIDKWRDAVKDDTYYNNFEKIIDHFKSDDFNPAGEERALAFFRCLYRYVGSQSEDQFVGEFNNKKFKEPLSPENLQDLNPLVDPNVLDVLRLMDPVLIVPAVDELHNILKKAFGKRIRILKFSERITINKEGDANVVSHYQRHCVEKEKKSTPVLCFNWEISSVAPEIRIVPMALEVRKKKLGKVKKLLGLSVFHFQDNIIQVRDAITADGLTANLGKFTKGKRQDVVPQNILKNRLTANLGEFKHGKGEQVVPEQILKHTKNTKNVK